MDVQLDKNDIVLSFFSMAQILVRNLEDDIRERLRERARRNRRSMEAEAREILRASVLGTPEGNEARGFGSRMHALFGTEDVGAADFELRGEAAKPATFEE